MKHSSESKQEENDNTHCNHSTKNERVSALAKVYLLDNTVDERKSSCFKILSRKQIKSL